MNNFDLKILLLSGLPLTELRVTIPMAIAMGMEPQKAFMLGVLGNIIPVIPVLLFLEPLSKLISFIPQLDRLFQRLITQTRKKSIQVQKYGAIGLILFVGVPLPGTGAWTGAIMAWLFGINFWLAFTAITFGVIIAGLCLTLGSIGFSHLVYIFYEIEYLIIIGLILLLLYFWWKRKNI